METRLVTLRATTIMKLLSEADLGDLVLLAAISAHTRFGTCRASVPTLAAWIGIHERTARKRMNALVDLGYVRESPIPGLARAKREIIETGSGATVEIEAGIDLDDSFGLLLLLMALGLPYTGALDDLARTAGLSRPTMNGLLDRLIGRNFVTIERKSRALFCIVPTGTFSGTGGSPKKSADVRPANRLADLQQQALAILRSRSSASRETAGGTNGET
jgi:hypothetical protein